MASRDSLLTVYHRLTGLVEKLPGGLQKPILRELTPIRELFLEQRPARILLAGQEPADIWKILQAFGSPSIEPGTSDNGWRTYQSATHGCLEIFDASTDTPDSLIDTALARAHPDLVIVLENQPATDAEWERIADICSSTSAPLMGLVPDNRSALRLRSRMTSHPSLARRSPMVLMLDDPSCVETICAALPLCAQLEFARLTNARRAQAHIAGSLLKSFSAVCGVIGVQPIPFADMPILTSLQTLMVGLIIHTTGRPFSLRLVAEFLGALGLNIGAGFALREGARSILKFIPIWGNAISGFIAGAGTYAIGRAAISYFIEETPITQTRRIFRQLWKRSGPPPSEPPTLPGNSGT